MPLFGRKSSPDVERVLRALLNGAAQMRAVARNLMHDHRVDKIRESVLRSFFRKPLDAGAFEEAVTAYRDDHVRYTATPDFINDAVNRPNILAGTTFGEHVVSRDLELGRVLNLSMRDFYSTARDRGVKAFASAPDGDPIRTKSWIDVHMEEEASRIRFVRAVLANLWPNKGTYPFEPCWVTTWDVLEAVADEPASRWAEVVGVPAAPGDWLILLRYRVREVGTLVRPTQLDSGWNAIHFPSPPTTPLAGGGHPMDLGIKGCPAALRPEFIHQHIEHPPAHWETAGSRTDRVPDNEVLAERDIIFQRRRHWTLLRDRDGAPIPAWMPEPE